MRQSSGHHCTGLLLPLRFLSLVTASTNLDGLALYPSRHSSLPLTVSPSLPPSSLPPARLPFAVRVLFICQGRKMSVGCPVGRGRVNTRVRSTASEMESEIQNSYRKKVREEYDNGAFRKAISRGFFSLFSTYSDL